MHRVFCVPCLIRMQDHLMSLAGFCPYHFLAWHIHCICAQDGTPTCVTQVDEGTILKRWARIHQLNTALHTALPAFNSFIKEDVCGNAQRYVQQHFMQLGLVFSGMWQGLGLHSAACGRLSVPVLCVRLLL